MSGRLSHPRGRLGPGTLTTLAVAVAAALAPTAAAAAEPAVDAAPITWSVTPAGPDGPDGRRVAEVELDPGESTTEHLAIRNLSEREATFALTASDGYYTSTGRFTMLPQSEPSVDAGTWVRVEPSVTLAANETRVVTYTVTVPADATPGDHAAGIAAAVRSVSADDDGTRVGVDSRVGFRVSTRVTGELAPALRVNAARADYVPSWNLLAPGRLEVSYDAVNAGNTALGISDEVDGVSAARGTLLPGESRRITVDAVAAWPLGLLFADLSVGAAVPGADLSVASTALSLTAWAVPWLHLLAAFGLALLIAAAFVGRRRRRRNVEELVRRAREEGRRESTRVTATS